MLRLRKYYQLLILWHSQRFAQLKFADFLNLLVRKALYALKAIYVLTIFEYTSLERNGN